MKIQKRSLMDALVILVCVLGAAYTLTQAQSGGGYDLTWNTLESGGEAASGGGFSLSGSMGQADAGQTLNGGQFSLTGGFWSEFQPYSSYLPAVQK
jgi:hypothetical protein